MLKKIFTLSIFISLSVMTLAQRFGYVDTEYILQSLPQYASAQSKVDSQAENWAKEISNHEFELEKDLAAFEAEKVLLTKDQIAKKEQDITTQKDLISNLKLQRYGPTGDLIALRRNLVKPIQDQVWNTVKKVAERRKYSFVFDKGSDLIMIYSDPKYDISEEVLRLLLPEGTPSVRKGKDVQNKRNNNTNQQLRNKKIN